MLVLVSLMVFFFGACVGSFLNVVIWRLPRGEKLTGRSKCPKCQKQLSWQDLFPLASFLVYRGQCRYCGKSISWRYFTIELVSGLLFLMVFLLQQPQHFLDYFLLGRSLFFIAVLIVVFVVDFEYYLILDNWVLPSSIIMFLSNLFWDFQTPNQLAFWSYHSVVGAVGALAGGLPFFLIWYFSRGQFMGFGDVKLLIFLGLALGWPLVAVNVFLAVIAGGLASIILLAKGLKRLDSQIAFGTFLSLAGIITLYFGQNLLKWYLSLIIF